jgi:hypothetical protein
MRLLQLVQPGKASRALRATETETETDRSSINRKPTDGRFSKDLFSIFPIQARFFCMYIFEKKML